MTLSVDWSPNGHELATASEDCSVKIWDLRMGKSGCIENLAAHTGIVSQVKYYQGALNNYTGNFI